MTTRVAANGSIGMDTIKGSRRTVITALLILGGVVIGLGGMGLLALRSFGESMSSGSGQEVHPHSDLLRSGDLVGWMEQEVLDKVGEPAWRSDRAWYDLGPNGGHHGLVIYWEMDDFDRAILMIHFEVGSRVVKEIDVRRLPDSRDEQPFDAAAWRSATPEERQTMIRGLVNDPELAGATASTVFEILGPPMGQYRELNYEDLQYSLWEETLCIHLVLDENGVVVEQYTTDY